MMTNMKPNRLLQLITCLFLILITLAAYWKVQHNDFINLDDNLYITDNPYIKKGWTTDNLLWAFTNAHACHWHPMTWLSHMLDVELFGLHPGGHHMVSLIFHVVNSLLLFFLFQKMTGEVWKCALIAGLFALHPLRVESIAWAAERKDVLSVFFFFLTIYTYLHYIEKIKFRRYLLTLLSFAMALMSKPMVVTLPFVLLLLDYWPLGRFQSKKKERWHPMIQLTIEKIPFFLFTFVMSIFTVVNHLQGGAVTPFDKLPFSIRIGNAFISYIRYIWKMLCPNELAVFYPHPIHLPLWEVIGAILLIIFITIVVIAFRREHPYLAIGWFWYLGTLIPVIGLVQAGTQAMADRFTYIPMVGLFLMISFGIPNIFMRRGFTRIILIPSGIFIFLILAILSAIQVGRWQNSVTLFTHTLNVTSNNYLIHNNLGVTLMRQGKYPEALFHLKKAMEIKPNYADAYHNLGTLLLLQGNEKEALDHFTLALEYNPKKAETHSSIGGILAKQEKFKEALFHFSEAVRLNKEDGEAHYNLGTILLQQGKTQEGVYYLNQSLETLPENPKTHHNLGLAFESMGKFEKAVEHYRKSLRIDSKNADTHFCLASLFSKQGRGEDAIFHLNETIKLNPGDSEAHYLLGNIFLAQNKYEEAISPLMEAARINPNHGKAHFALGEIYLSMGKKELALRQYQILQKIDDPLAKLFHQKILNIDN
ncbi:MAG: tetratricopeptide repeat protein [Deltaproteobacteria bacterium]|nr:tetratricopeptide repeat protein [Deltaproteobacteria bacterium]